MNRLCTSCGWCDEGWTACANGDKNRPGALFCVTCNSRIHYVADLGELNRAVSVNAFGELDIDVRYLFEQEMQTRRTDGSI